MQLSEVIPIVIEYYAAILKTIFVLSANQKPLGAQEGGCS